MRVAIDARPAHAGLTGIGRYAANLVQSIEGVPGIDPLVITSRSGLDYLHSIGCACPSAVVCAGDESDEVRIAAAMSNHSTQIVHSPFFLLPPVAPGCASIVTAHDVIPLVRPDLCPASFLEFFHRHAREAFLRAGHVIAVSEFSRADLLRHVRLDPERVTSIHEAVSPLFDAAPRPDDARVLRELGVSRGFALSVGAIDRRKNLRALLEAHAVLRWQVERLPELVVVGGPSGDGYDIAADVVRTGGGGAVRLLGRVDDGALAALYRSASCLVFPSLYEGFGLPVVEAMASGTPVVASRASAIPEVASDAALLVESRDVAELARAIRRILTEPALRASLRERGLHRAAAFTPTRQGEHMARLYRRVLERAA